MNGLALLMADAGESDAAEAFAGTCSSCGRGMYKRNQGEVGKQQGWLMKANTYRCMTCYQRARKSELAVCLPEVLPEPTEPDPDRDNLRVEAASLRASGLSVRAISFRIGRSERVTSRLLTEFQVGDRDLSIPSRFCATCNRRMRTDSDPKSWGVMHKARGECVACVSRDRRQRAKAS